MSAELIQCRLEVIEDDTVGKAFEDKRELPEWVDNTYRDHRCHRKQIYDDADNTQAHATEEYAEAWGHPDDVDETELVLELNVPKEVPDGEDPPWIAEFKLVSDKIHIFGLCRREVPEYRLIRPRG